jgi:choline-sulfatase
MYQESVCVPLILAGPGIASGQVETPVSLLDLSETILDHFGADVPSAGNGGRAGGEPAIRPGRSLYRIAAEP